jgi:hypothetical protein
MILASSYDQSCTEDTDCAEVTSGDYCSPNLCECGGSAVNVGAVAQFDSDVAKASMGVDAALRFACPCLESPGPCCRGGTCTTVCNSPSDTLPACASAGGTCSSPGVQCSVGYFGPPNSCAYADELCCLPIFR